MNRDSSRTAATVIVLLFSIVLGIYAIYSSSGAENDRQHTSLTTTTAASTTATMGTTENIGYTVSADVPQTLKAGQAQAIIAQTVPYTPAVDILWYSADPSIADVTLTGEITAVSPGTVEIYCTTLDPNRFASVELTYMLTVVEKTDGGVPVGNDLLSIANTNNLLSESFIPDRLVEIGEKVPTLNDGLMLTEPALNAYIQLYNAMRASGIGEVYIISGYRSYARQVELFENRTQKFLDDGYGLTEAQRRAALTVNPPGASEHQLGVSIDVSTDGNTQHDFNTLPQGAWIKENAHRFGFVIRYPDDKTKITGINYEPWHLRFVGLEHAQYMYEHGLCLEEYVLL